MPDQDTDIPIGSHEAYNFPRRELFLKFPFNLLFGIKRSFAADCWYTLRSNPPLPEFVGLENVPADGSFVVVGNHYERPGVEMYFAGMAVAAAVAQARPASPEMHWIITSEWRGRHFGPFPIPVWPIRWVFSRIARVYGFVTMPQREEETAGRAAALRQAATIINSPAGNSRGQRREGEPVGLMPEARGKGTLIEAMPGSGLFLRMLTKAGAPVLPVGLYEEGGGLVVKFGEPFQLQVKHRAGREEEDRLVREQAMVAVGRLLPERMWGFYADAIAKSLER